MAKLYIANCTKQHQDFQYRIPETGKLTAQPIPVGQQIMVYKDTNRHELEQIVAQHEVYGLLPVSEARKAKGFVGLCYDYDKPVSMEVVVETVEHNDEALEQRSQEIREDSVAATEHQMKEQVQQAGGDAEDVSGLEVEVVEQKAPNDPNGETFKQTIASTTTKQKQGRR